MLSIRNQFLRKGATKMIISYIPVTSALLNHDKRYILNGHWTVSLGHRRYTYGGNTIFYSGASPENETIRIPSTLATPMEIQVSF